MLCLDFHLLMVWGLFHRTGSDPFFFSLLLFNVIHKCPFLSDVLSSVSFPIRCDRYRERTTVHRRASP